jgi:hypothetical protein
MDLFSWLTELSDADFQEVIDSLNKVAAKIPFLLMLSAEDRQRLFKMGSKYEGFANEIEQTAANFPSAIPPANPIDIFKAKRKQYDQLTQICDLASSVYQMCNDTRLQLGSERLACANIYYNSFQKLSKTDIAIEEALDKLSVSYAKTSHSEPTLYTIPPKGSISIKGVVTGTQLVNKGTAVVSCKAGNELASKVKEPAIIIDPASSKAIPKGWTTIEVTNLSETNEATISVRKK